jgi:hypothetical protein
MPLPIGGEISAGQINNEFGRGFGSYFDIWTARNGGYGGINDASGYRPTAAGSGYAFSDWWGYFHSASRPYVYIFKYEGGGSCSIRLYKFNVYGGADWAERWYFYNIGPWHDASGGGDGNNGPAAGVRTNERITFLWNHFGWGNPWQNTYKAVYSPFRGTFISWGCDPVVYQRYAEVSGVISGEAFYVYSVEYYC